MEQPLLFTTHKISTKETAMADTTKHHTTLLPSSVFPKIEVEQVGGGKIDLQASGKAKLIHVYRGGFCPFCVGTIKHLVEEYASLQKNDIELVVVSADLKEVAEKTVKDLNVNFPVGYGLTVEQLVELGVFVSTPTNYIAQKHMFAEPAVFLLTPDNKIKYVAYGSAPPLARPNVPQILGAYLWAKEEAVKRPEFASVVWGSVDTNNLKK